MLTRSLGLILRAPGMPCAISSLTLMQVAPGKAEQFRSRTSPGRFHVRPPELIELERGHAGLDGLAHRLERVGNDAPDLLQARQLVVARHGHVVTFCMSFPFCMPFPFAKPLLPLASRQSASALSPTDRKPLRGLTVL